MVPYAEGHILSFQPYLLHTRGWTLRQEKPIKKNLKHSKCLAILSHLEKGEEKKKTNKFNYFQKQESK